MNVYQKILTSILPKYHDELQDENNYTKIMFTIHQKYTKLVYDYDTMESHDVIDKLKDISKYVILNILRTTPLTYQDLFDFLNTLEEDANEIFKQEDEKVSIEETLLVIKQIIDNNISHSLEEKISIQEYTANLYELALASFPVLKTYEVSSEV